MEENNNTREKEKIAFLEKDIEVLDFIIDKIIISPIGIIFENVKDEKYFDLKVGGLESMTYLSDQTNEFVRILGIINSYDCSECEFYDLKVVDSQNHIKKSKKTLQFKKLGGFRKEYNDKLKLNERENKLIKKEANDLWITSNTKRTFYILLILSAILSALTFYYNYMK